MTWIIPHKKECHFPKHIDLNRSRACSCGLKTKYCCQFLKELLCISCPSLWKLHQCIHIDFNQIRPGIIDIGFCTNMLKFGVTMMLLFMLYSSSTKYIVVSLCLFCSVGCFIEELFQIISCEYRCQFIS